MKDYLQLILLEASDNINLFVKENSKDLLWDTYNKSVGGQHVNHTIADVRLTHIPTGKTVEANSFRSIHLNRQLAVLLLIIKLNQ
jgi:protein subunit release factor B